ncbi:hypothetical protein [Mycolicibacterium mageritense]|uniref:hypothetical protein n=1 Tax=Mycolicibacterium mageritense TaxID=53462 RepID=UPI0011D41A94|nr:hypothetical protein [Mycolicibacterium mageritense]TXI62209.1 MAG: hypothetical protein E6Q55_13660 [Mycolicibacterium mageritense]
MWANLKRSIDGGFGVVMNWVAPPSNKPRGVKGSVSPRYSGGTTYHYVAAMGYDDDPAARAVWIADSGFQPQGYWISFDQCASLIPPKGYAFADVAPATGGPSTPPPAADQVAVLAQAMSPSVVAQDRFAALLPAVIQCLDECGCTTVERIAMWAAQVGHESGGLRYMEEIADGSAYNNRPDLGNTQPGDGPRFKGRGPIQVTGRNNYTELSKWAFAHGLVPTATFFVDDPAQLASDRYGFLGLVWYWTTQRPMNDLADRRDIEGASIAVNGTNPKTGRANGIEDRIGRYNRALAMGDALLTLTQSSGGITMSAAEELEAQSRGVFPPSDQQKRGGWPQPWRFVFSRFPRPFNAIVKDPARGPWGRVQPDGSWHDGHTDSDEQTVTVAEQIAWRNTFSDGITRDHGDVMIELMEDLIARRKAAGQSTSPASDALKASE